MWDNNGSWHTPWFGEEHDQNYYEEDKYYNLKIDIPIDLSSQIGSGSLVIQLEVDTREEEGWQEEVSFWEGAKYKLYTERKTWVDAEATCQEEGGHLASVLSDEEQEEVRAAKIGVSHIWIGATDSREEGVWRWADGSPWGYQNWIEGAGKSRKGWNCVFIVGNWSHSPCTDTFPFLCQSPPARVLSGNKSLTLEYSAQSLTFPYLKVLYRYTAKQQLLLDSWQDKRMAGLKLRWFIKNPQLVLTTNEIGITLQTPGFRERNLMNPTLILAETTRPPCCFQATFRLTVGPW